LPGESGPKFFGAGDWHVLFGSIVCLGFRLSRKPAVGGLAARLRVAVPVVGFYSLQCVAAAWRFVHAMRFSERLAGAADGKEIADCRQHQESLGAKL